MGANLPVDISLLTPHRRAVDDNRRWADFDNRPGDIFICTPAKCGTTWTQTIVASLMWPDGDQPDTVGQLSPWIEARLTHINNAELVDGMVDLMKCKCLVRSVHLLDQVLKQAHGKPVYLRQLIFGECHGCIKIFRNKWY